MVAPLVASGGEIARYTHDILHYTRHALMRESIAGERTPGIGRET
jgi:hypothetical protein